eukprot:2394461-Prorocentrum_lima.AAC.1
MPTPAPSATTASSAPAACAAQRASRRYSRRMSLWICAMSGRGAFSPEVVSGCVSVAAGPSSR